MMHRQLNGGMRLAGVVLAAMMLAACNHSGSSSSSSSSDQQTIKPLARVRPAPSAPQATMLKAGQPPLNLMFDQGGHIRILDMTAGKTLADRTVEPGTIISIDADAGVVLGRDIAQPGPLSAQHRYEIWWYPR